MVVFDLLLLLELLMWLLLRLDLQLLPNLHFVLKIAIKKKHLKVFVLMVPLLLLLVVFVELWLDSNFFGLHFLLVPIKIEVMPFLPSLVLVVVLGFEVVVVVVVVVVEFVVLVIVVVAVVENLPINLLKSILHLGQLVLLDLVVFELWELVELVVLVLFELERQALVFVFELLEL